MEVATGRMRAILLAAWLRPLVVGLSLLLVTCGGSWVALHLESNPFARVFGNSLMARSLWSNPCDFKRLTDTR